MPRIFGIDPERVIIPVMILLIHRVQRLAAVERLVQLHVHYENAVYILGIGHDSRVIHCAGVELVPPLPRRAFVIRAKDAALAIRGLNGRIHHIRIGRRNRQPNPSHIHAGQS